MRLARISHELGDSLGVAHAAVVFGTAGYAEYALALGQIDVARSLLDDLDAVPAGLRPPMLEVVRAGLRARLGVGDEDAEFGEAIAILRRIDRVWELATMLEAHGHSLEARGRDGSAELAEAREIYVRVGATPAIASIDAAIAATAARSA